MIKFGIHNPSQCLSAVCSDIEKIAPGALLASMYIQLWDTPALGFLGVAAVQDTPAFTTVFSDPDTGVAYVYFDGRFAYKVMQPNEQFGKDVMSGDVKSMLFASEYETVIQEESQD